MEILHADPSVLELFLGLDQLAVDAGAQFFPVIRDMPEGEGQWGQFRGLEIMDLIGSI